MKIFSVLEKKKQELKGPGKFKKFWIEFFGGKIEPKYHFEITVKLADIEDARKIVAGHIIDLHTQTGLFIVLSVEEKIIKIANLKPTKDFNMPETFSVFANAHPEKA